MIPDVATLGNLVSLTVESLGSCAAPTPVLHSGKPQKTLPLTLKPKQKLDVVFEVTFSCANDPAKSTKGSPGHEDYRFTATVNHAARGVAVGFHSYKAIKTENLTLAVSAPAQDILLLDFMPLV